MISSILALSPSLPASELPSPLSPSQRLPGAEVLRLSEEGLGQLLSSLPAEATPASIAYDSESDELEPITERLPPTRRDADPDV